MIVPGDIASALIDAGEVPDPYFGRAELDVQWIGREDWLLEKRIELDAQTLERDQVFLDFDMIDTIAEIRINGELVGRSENMFRRFRADAKRFLRPGANAVSILIRSAERAAAERAKKLPYPIPQSEYPISSPHRNLVRKSQCMSGWDWGPCLMTGGAYGRASLVAADGPRIEYATTRVRREGSEWLVRVAVELESAAPRAAAIEASIAGAHDSRALGAFTGTAREELEMRVPASSVQAWWPAGYGPDPSGPRPLYDLAVRVAPASTSGAARGGSDRGHEVRRRIGFRELEVAADEDEAGRCLTFRVNGRDVFCKGANWIPADALPSRWSRERLDDLLSSALAANMNCLRAWGGGIYESEDFYDLCDEKGILVWQDFAFSCALYPSSPDFLAEVEAEARHQVKRLADRACLALWCGNNENLGALGWFAEAKRDPMRYAVDYDRLYEGAIGRVVRELDPDRTYWPSSPCGGPSDYSDNWHRDGRGDMHFWSVWHEGKDFSEYMTVKPRFCSEFGFQSFPNPGTVASFSPEGERNVTSPIMEHHQRHPRGNALIVETMARNFRMPSGALETLYLSQVQQALAIRTAVEYWRSLRPTCMGTLYWQLNDVWPVSSWSSLDYDGSWKLLHYEARRFYDPILLALFVKDGIVRARVVNDRDRAFACRLGLRLRRFDGTIAASYSAQAAIDGDSSTELWSMPLSDLPCRRDEAFLEASAEPDSSERPRTAVLFLTEPKRCPLADARLDAAVETGPRGLELVLRASAPAFYVAPYLEGALGAVGRFEDAGFHLMAGEERHLAFEPARGKSAPSADELRKALRVMHLRASYEQSAVLRSE